MHDGRMAGYSFFGIARRASWPELRLILFFAAPLLGAGLLLAFVLSEVHREAGRQADTDVRNVVASLEASLDASLRRVHAELDDLALWLPQALFEPGVSPETRAVVSRELRLRAARFPEIADFRIVDAVGEHIDVSALPATGVDLAAHRQYVAALRGSSPGLRFSDVVEQEGGFAVLFASLPLRDGKGRLLGLLVAQLDLQGFQRHFAAFGLGSNGVLAIRRSDNGKLVLRHPALPGAINHVQANNPVLLRVGTGELAGTIRDQGRFDGVERLYAFRRVGDYPFYVVAGVASEDYLGSWQKIAVVAGVSYLLLVLALSLVLFRLLRLEREEARISSRLAESEARYRLLAENSHDMIWTLDIPSRRYTYVSPAAFALLGCSPQALLGKPLALALTPASADRVGREIDQCLRRIAAGDSSAQVVISELEQMGSDGALVSTEAVFSYLLDHGGIPRTILGISRNVSERKRAERALLESNHTLQVQLEEIRRLQSALQEQAVRDGLTGLYNRRYLDEMLEREVSRARREGIALSLVMIDIDHFKRINDTYGHQAGDEVLRMLAATLLADIRTEDMACRYGGEEFLILLPNMPLAFALGRAEIWRKAVAALSPVHGKFQIHFTISLGVAAYPEHGKTPDDLTRCADLALYRAKHEGRNRVVKHPV